MATAMRLLGAETLPEPLPEPPPEPADPLEENEAVRWARRHLAWERWLDGVRAKDDSPSEGAEHPR